MERPVFSVSELNGFIKQYFEANPFFSNICVLGEISNYKRYPSGHHYFSLKDAGETLSCVMFKGNAYSLRFVPENGMQVMASGRVSVFPRDGKYQLYVETMLPTGRGDLQAAFEQLKARLDAEGLFSPEHKKPLPEFPKTIAVITSPAGAAVRDIIRILGCRWPSAKVAVVPVAVQGEEAAGEISRAVRLVNKAKCADLIITGRGGGSLEDLWAFNEETVARAIYESKIPVISAVGHEPDVTIADYVADARASTPSNAAEIAVPDAAEISACVSNLSVRLASAEEARLDRLKKSLSVLAEKKVLKDPREFFALRGMDLDILSGRLAACESAVIARKRQTVAALSAALDAMSPLKVVSRGYFIVKDEAGKSARGAASLSPGCRAFMRSWDGEAICTVDSVNIYDHGET